ncbi:MAG: copper resistance protein CopC [Candidatus Promineifilaceae bacterium]|nr:copper resistance protein CopC [Candidatus Promineifilaceae bacterium]
MRRRLAILLAGIGLLLAGTVQAHVLLLDAVPKPGSTLAAAPQEIRLTFSDVLAPGSTLNVVDETFTEAVGLTPAVDPADRRQLWAAVPAGALDPGRYTVQWLVSGPDGDTVSGSYAFAIAAQSAPGPWAMVGLGVTMLAVLALALWFGVRRRRRAAA